MENKKLLIDTMIFEVTPQQINESLKNNGGKLIVKGILQKANTQNQNGRIYPREILEREAKKYMDTYIKENRGMGELDHPSSSVINLKNVSHNIKNIKWNGDDLVGTIEILGTPSGNILKELFKSGIRVGISSRGLGSVMQKEGVDEVQDDYELLCWDFVSTPSTPGAFMSAVNESLNPKRTPEKYDKINKIISEILSQLR